MSSENPKETSETTNGEEKPVVNTIPKAPKSKVETLELEEDELWFDEEEFYDDAFDESVENEAFKLEEKVSPEEKIEKKVMVTQKRTHTKVRSDGNIITEEILFGPSKSLPKMNSNSSPFSPLELKKKKFLMNTGIKNSLEDSPKSSPRTPRKHRRTKSDANFDMDDDFSVCVTKDLFGAKESLPSDVVEDEESKEKEKIANEIIKEIENIDDFLKGNKDIVAVRRKMKALERKHFKFFIELKYSNQFSNAGSKQNKTYTLAKAKLIVFDAKIHFHVKAFSKAIKKLRNAISLNIFDFKMLSRVAYMLALCHFCRAGNYLNKKLYEGAMDDYNEVLHLLIDILGENNEIEDVKKRDDLLLKLFNNRGLTFKRLGLHDYAIHDYLHSLLMDKTNVAVYNNLVNVYGQKGDKERAKEYFEKGLGIRKNQAVLFNSFGAFYFQRCDTSVDAVNDCKEAIKNFQKALYFNDKYEPAKRNLIVAKKKLVTKLELKNAPKNVLPRLSLRKKGTESSDGSLSKREKKKLEKKEKQKRKTEEKRRKTMDKKKLLYKQKKNENSLYKDRTIRKLKSRPLGVMENFILSSFVKKSTEIDNIALVNYEEKVELPSGNVINMSKKIFKIKMSDIKISSFFVGGKNTSFFNGLWYNIPISFKSYPTSKELSKEKFTAFQKEMCKYVEIRHKNILKVFGFCIQPLHIGVITESIECGSLKEFLSLNKRNVGMEDKLEILYQVAIGIRELHSRGIIVRDLTLESVLIGCVEGKRNSFLPKINFGLNRLIERMTVTKTMMSTSSLYKAPEIKNMFRDEDYGEKTDSYAYGVFMYKLLMFGNESNSGEVNLKGIKGYPKWCITLMKDCMQKKSIVRPDFIDISMCFEVEGVLVSSIYDEIKRDPVLISVADRTCKDKPPKDCVFTRHSLKELRIFVLKIVGKEHVKNLKVYSEVDDNEFVEINSDYQVEKLEDGTLLEVEYEEISVEYVEIKY